MTGRMKNVGDNGCGRRAGATLEVFLVFLKLGLTSFGGPVAHLGYFRNELVVRRRWVDEAAYADLVGLCQFIPGPASSQVGFGLGVLRAGSLAGGLAAWLGFTLPSASFLFACAMALGTFSGLEMAGLIHGLKLVAVVVVAQAVQGMARTLTPDARRRGVALLALLLCLLAAGAFSQIVAIAAGALAGLMLCRRADTPLVGRLDARVQPVSTGKGIAALVLFAGLLIVLPFLAHSVGRMVDGQALRLFEAFYRTGALVFGGGHVVLPLLQSETVASGWVSSSDFLSGYGLAQAVPGPLFSFAAFLGAVAGPAPHGLAGAVIALVGIFLPGLLLVYGMLPFWDQFRTRSAAQAAMRGANAAVVGVLAAAFINPVWTSAILAPTDFFLAVGGFLLLVLARVPAWSVVLMLAAAGLVLAVA